MTRLNLRRGELYRVAGPPRDTKSARVFLVVSRDAFLDASHSTAMCVPVYSNYHGIRTEVLVGSAEGLKETSALQCDQVTSLRRSLLTNYVGSLPADKWREVNEALAIALDLDEPGIRRAAD